MVPTPIHEIADRYTIAVLKAERCTDPIEIARAKRQMEFYAETGKPNAQLDKVPLNLLTQLLDVNREMWDTEGLIRRGEENSTTLEEIGRLALSVRDINRRRNGIKNDILNRCGSPDDDIFREMKVNYAQGSSSTQARTR